MRKTVSSVVSELDADSDSKEDRIVERLRAHLLSGEWEPQSRLPSHRALGERLQVSTRTIYNALSRLTAEGFLETKDRSATLVASHPPHLFRYGLVFPWEAREDKASLLWQAFLGAAERVKAESPEYSFPSYHGIDRIGGRAQYERLMTDIRAHRLGGIIFANPPRVLAGTDVILQERIPAVALQSHVDMPHLGYMDAQGASVACLRQGCAWLAEQRRRRLGILLYVRDEGWPAEAIKATRKEAGKYGIRVEPGWVHALPVNSPEAARSLLELLMRLSRNDRPDALMILDDNLVEGVAAACVSLGIRVPDEVALVGHANFPCLPRHSVPVHLTGYDMEGFLRACLRWFEAEREGANPPRAIPIAACDTKRA